MYCVPGSCDAETHHREIMEPQILKGFKKSLEKFLSWKFPIFLGKEMIASDHLQSYDAVRVGVVMALNPTCVKTRNLNDGLVYSGAWLERYY